MAKYLVTGCAGFIGARVTEGLLDGNHHVTGVDNLNDSYDVRLKKWRLQQLKPKERFESKILDITNRETLKEMFLDQKKYGGFDAVINLAARVGVRQSVENPWVYFETNVMGALNLLELCKEFEVKKFVLASTSSLYGVNNPSPFKEDANTNNPLSPYASSKKSAEALCYTYHYLYDIDVTVLRYFTVYGPSGRPDMSPFRFVQWIFEERPLLVYGDGKQSRDFTYVDDIARGTIAGLKPLGYEVINLGSDKPIVLLDLIRVVENLVGKDANIKYESSHPADMRATWADINKAKRLLNWTPQTEFEDGVAKTVDWYKRNREWAKTIQVF